MSGYEGIGFFGAASGDAKEYAKVGVRYIIANNVLSLFSICCLLLVLCTAGFASSIHRRGTWFAFLGSWLITSVGHTLLMGRQFGPPPSTEFCLFQTVFIYSNPALNALTAVAFIIEAYTLATQAWPSACGSSILFYIVPAVVYVGVMIEVLVLGVRNPQWVRRDPTGMYCHFAPPISAQITSGIVIASMLVVLLFEILVGVVVYRSWKAKQEFEFCERSPCVDFNVTVRFAIFNLGVAFALTFGLWSFIPQTIVNSARLDTALNTLPFLASAIFGIHKDFFRVWFSCFFPREDQTLPYVHNSVP